MSRDDPRRASYSEKPLDVPYLRTTAAPSSEGIKAATRSSIEVVADERTDPPGPDIRLPFDRTRFPLRRMLCGGVAIGAPMGLAMAIALGIAVRDKSAPPWYLLLTLGPVGGAIAGMIAGTFLWLIAVPEGLHRRASVVGSVLALLAVPSGFVPFFGLVIALPAFLANHRAAGWQNGASRWGLAIGLAVLSLFFGTFLVIQVGAGLRRR
jgi:hypothetical protein